MDKNIPDHLQYHLDAPYNTPEERPKAQKSYRGFNYNGTCFTFTRSLTDYIMNYSYAYIIPDAEKKLVQIGFSREFIEGSHNVVFSDGTPKINIKLPGMSYGRYLQSAVNPSIYIHE